MKNKLLLFSALLLFLFGAQAQNALDFDGSNDYVMMTASGPSGTANRTVEAWIKTSNSQSQQQILVDWGTMSTGNRFTLNIINFGKLRIEIGGNGFNSTATVADGQWHHVAVTYDNGAATKAKLYIDGVLDASNNFTVAMNTNSTGPIILGRRNDMINYYQGMMDEVRIWNFAKTASEIQAGMNNTACGSTNGLVAYYTFNHGTAQGNNAGVTTLTDYAGTNDGTLNNFTLNGSTSNWVNGKQLSSAQSDSVAVQDSLCDGYKYFMGPFVYDQPGVYQDTLSNSAGCDSIIHLTLYSQSTDATAKYVGQSFVANNSSNNASYQWVNCSNWGVLVGETNQTYWPSDNGEYAVFVTENGCMDTSDCMSLLYASLEDSPWEGLNIYPNPTTQFLNIDFSETPGDLQIQIIDITGKTILSTEIEGLKTKIDVGELNEGLYFVQLSSKNYSFSSKFYKT
ncbi:MAG: T9SS type A sorting domain-containing protein [Schleiferiaceae bacterium]|nr:T9SS type A sorting domain-containing protein [Schleiferiaceae bacterium]